jgi:hypothetical protein
MIYVKNGEGEIVHSGDLLSCKIYVKNSYELFGIKGLYLAVKKPGIRRGYEPYTETGE